MKGRLTANQAKLILHGTDEEWYKYVLRHARGRRMPELEPYIARFPKAACLYACWAIHGRWSEGEPAIANGSWAINYALNIIGGRWPEAEPYIMRDPWLAAKYSAWVIKGRWPEAEEVIGQDPKAWNWYTEGLEMVY
jgi:hypothetical protein